MWTDSSYNIATCSQKKFNLFEIFAAKMWTHESLSAVLPPQWCWSPPSSLLLLLRWLPPTHPPTIFFKYLDGQKNWIVQSPSWVWGMLVRWGEAWCLDPHKIHPRDLTTCAFPPTHMMMMMTMMMPMMIMMIVVLMMMMVMVIIIIEKSTDDLKTCRILTDPHTTNIGVTERNIFKHLIFGFDTFLKSDFWSDTHCAHFNQDFLEQIAVLSFPLHVVLQFYCHFHLVWFCSFMWGWKLQLHWIQEEVRKWQI